MSLHLGSDRVSRQFLGCPEPLLGFMGFEDLGLVEDLELGHGMRV